MADGDFLVAELEELADEFLIECEIGRGGMAVVYRARDRALGRPVALKIIRGRLIGDRVLTARLEREARLVGRLDHANIVTIHAVRRLRDGGIALVLQYLGGGTLRTELARSGALSVARARRVLTDVASALGAAHAQGVIHRDVKPENIHLQDGGERALLSDFGSAAPLENDGRLTIPGMAIGTPGYMAPELVDGGAGSAAADVYSLGLVGWEMLSGREPWTGTSLFEVLSFRKHGQLPSVRSLRTDVTLRLSRIIERAIHPDPSMRWQSGAEMLAALEDRLDPLEGEHSDAAPALVRSAADDAPGAPGVAAGHGLVVAMPAMPGRPVLRLDGGLAPPPAPSARLGATEVPEDERVPGLSPTDVVERLSVMADTEPSAAAGAPRRRAYALGAAAVAAVLVGALYWGGGALPRPDVPTEIALGGDVAALHEVPLGRAGAASPAARQSLPIDSIAGRVGGPDGRLTLAELAELAAIDGRPVLAPLGGSTDARSVPPAMPDPAAPPPSAELPDRARLPAGRVPVVEVPKLPAAGLVQLPRGGGIAAPTFEAALVRGAGDGAFPTASAPGGALQAREIRAGGSHTCALLTNGRVSCWGANERGQLGTRTDGGPLPQSVSSTSRFRTLALGQTHSCAVTEAGGALCWGANDRGQLGDGTRTDTYLPGQVIGVRRLVGVSVGGAHSCGLDGEGDVFCWGSNAAGQLGTGDDADRRVGTRLPDLFGARAVVTGWHHSCAVTADGSAHCWGANAEGQLGLEGGNRVSPTPVPTGERLRTLAAGSAHTCALTDAGMVLCWGRNRDGQLGNGTRAEARTPQAVLLPGPAIALAAGADHTCALLRDGEAHCWGQNRHGQLGSGTTQQSDTPALVGGGHGFVALHASGGHTCGVTAAQGVLCWGSNAQGQLGDGTRISRRRPVPVLGGTD